MSKPVPFTVADSSGRILCSGMCPEDRYSDQLANFGGALLLPVLANPQKEYVADGVVKPRQEMSVVADKEAFSADGIDCVTVSGIPAGSDVIFDGKLLRPNGTAVQLRTQRAGQHKIIVRAFPCIEATLYVEATAPAQ